LSLHIGAEEAVSMKYDNTYPGQAKPKESRRARPLRIHEAVAEKTSDTRRAPYTARKNQPRMKAKEDLPFTTKVPDNLQGTVEHARVVDKLKFPQKSDRNLGPRKETWCEFHKGFGHDVEHCITLGYQLAGLMKDEFLKEYLEGNQEGSKEEIASADQGHEVPVHGELNTISRGGCSASKCKKYTRDVMVVEARRSDQPAEPDLYFTSANLGDVAHMRMIQ